MSKRKTYRSSELKAGKTVHIVTREIGPMASTYGVASYLIGSKSEPQPQPGELHPYRMHPLVARFAESRTDAWKTRKAAKAEADRRQAHELSRLRA